MIYEKIYKYGVLKKSQFSRYLDTIIECETFYKFYFFGPLTSIWGTFYEVPVTYNSHKSTAKYYQSVNESRVAFSYI